jgi:hypothetical protein
MFGLEKVRPGKSYSKLGRVWCSDPVEVMLKAVGLEIRTCKTFKLHRRDVIRDIVSYPRSLRHQVGSPPTRDSLDEAVFKAAFRGILDMDNATAWDFAVRRGLDYLRDILNRGAECRSTLQGYVSTLALAEDLEASLKSLDLPKNQRRWLHTVSEGAKSSAPGSKTGTMRRSYELVKYQVGYGRECWVCKELLNYLQKYTFLRPRTTALQAMLHSRSVIWCRENNIPDGEFTIFQAPTIVIAMHLSAEQWAALEEVSNSKVSAAVLATSGLEELQTGTGFYMPGNGDIVEGESRVLNFHNWQRPEKSRLSAAMWFNGRTLYSSSHRDSPARRIVRGIAAIVPHRPNVLNWVPVPSLHKALRYVEWQLLEPSVNLPVTKSKEYFL